MARQIALGQPTRIQRRRTKGWRAPDGAVYVGRGTRWGNPYTITQCGPTHAVLNETGGVIFGGSSETDARRVAVDWYRAWLASQPDLHAAARQQLAGRDLMCWCPLPEPGDLDHCHAAVLLAHRERGAVMFAEAVDTLITLGWAALAWLVVVAAFATITVYAIAATVWWIGRAVWKTARRRPGGPSWRRGRLRARIYTRRRLRRSSRRPRPRWAHSQPLDHDYEECA